jgi:hypothetical protein
VWCFSLLDQVHEITISFNSMCINGEFVFWIWLCSNSCLWADTCNSSTQWQPWSWSSARAGLPPVEPRPYPHFMQFVHGLCRVYAEFMRTFSIVASEGVTDREERMKKDPRFFRSKAGSGLLGSNLGCSQIGQIGRDPSRLGRSRWSRLIRNTKVMKTKGHQVAGANVRPPTKNLHKVWFHATFSSL